jgi:lysophospholipid acyltransferase (LPLAT)-like uncharacterized protein
LKNLLRNDGVQAALGWVLGTYLRVILRTVRWRHENLGCVEPVLAGSSGAIALFWHGRIPLCLATAPQWWRKRTRAFVSPSADGEFIAQALAMSGVAWVAGGGALVVTPDGPRGPNELIAPGALQIARRSGQPVFLMGIAASPSIQLRTWDRVMFAAPFGRGSVVWDGPLFVPAAADEGQIAALIAAWSARLSAATRRAEALVGRSAALIGEPAGET